MRSTVPTASWRRECVFASKVGRGRALRRRTQRAVHERRARGDGQHSAAAERLSLRRARDASVPTRCRRRRSRISAFCSRTEAGCTPSGRRSTPRREGSRAALDLGLNYDFATGDWNEARLRAGIGEAPGVGYSVEARHSRPFFELWTIWGAFSPVGFDEGRATVDWRPRGFTFLISLHGAYRKYAETNAGSICARMAGAPAATRAGTGAARCPPIGSYDVDIGSGAADTDVRAGVRWAASATIRSAPTGW